MLHRVNAHTCDVLEADHNAAEHMLRLLSLLSTESCDSHIDVGVVPDDRGIAGAAQSVSTCQPGIKSNSKGAELSLLLVLKAVTPQSCA